MATGLDPYHLVFWINTAFHLAILTSVFIPSAILHIGTRVIFLKTILTKLLLSFKSSAGISGSQDTLSGLSSPPGLCDEVEFTLWVNNASGYFLYGLSMLAPFLRSDHLALILVDQLLSPFLCSRCFFSPLPLGKHCSRSHEFTRTSSLPKTSLETWSQSHVCLVLNRCFSTIPMRDPLTQFLVSWRPPSIKLGHHCFITVFLLLL